MSEKEKGDGGTGGGGDEVVLKRQVSLLAGVSLLVGTIIGSGIFISPKGVLRQTDSVGMSLVIWIACGVLSTCAALCYAELGTLVRKSGGEYAYLFEAFGPVPAYLFSWTYAIVLKPSSLAAITLTFGTYFVQLFVSGSCEVPVYLIKLFAITAILLIAFINSYSVKWATRVQIIFTAAKIFALIIIVFVGIVRLCQGHTEHLNTSVSFEGSSTRVFAYGIAFYQGLWAYDSWNQLNFVTEELVNPKRNLPLAILIGMPLVIVLYLLVNIAYFTVMSPLELLASDAVAVTLADRTLGVMAWIIPLFVCFSTFGAANGALFASGRLAFVSAREGHMMEILSMIHIKRFTPFPSIVFTSFIAIIFIIPNDFDTLVNYFSFAAWMFYGATFIALLVLRYKYPDKERAIKVPIFLPIAVLLAAVYLVLAPIIDQPELEFLYALIFIFAGLLLYFPFVYKKYSFSFNKTFTYFLQKLMRVVPPTEKYKE
ncbi:b(0,+)-type amino acid transporter 1-like [Antedon mediterranea]|uniref:b(0,+)-type amino acid transporter 1-like n=1 Tax=Antedon mediterranea TaxID=105859 RepID=UPI003AF9EB90